MSDFNGKCIVCEKEINEPTIPDDDGKDWSCYPNSNKFSFGYGSKLDTCYCRIFLCDECAVKKVANGTITNMMCAANGEEYTADKAKNDLDRNVYKFNKE